MAAHIPMSLPKDAKGETENKQKGPSYWNAENHQASSGNAYLRAEEWLQDLEEFTLPVKRKTVQLTHAMGQAIMRYREELKMYAALEDEKRGENREVDALEDVEFLDERHRAVKEEWPKGKERAEWWKALEELRGQLDAEIKELSGSKAEE